MTQADSLERAFKDASPDSSALRVSLDTTHQSGTYGFQLSWELDLFGRIRRETEAAFAIVLATEQGRRGVMVTLVADIYGAKAKKVTHKVETLHVVVDAAKGMAWFHGAIVATFTVDKKKVTQPMRISGIAADEDGWKIHALMYARTMPDRELQALAVEATRGKPKATGESTATNLVAKWFDGGAMSDDRSKNVAVEVNGTGAVEIGSGAFAVKLVKAWENLKLWATAVEATLFANNELAFVRADVMMPVDKQAVKLVLGVILAKENNAWRWVSLSLTPAGS